MTANDGVLSTNDSVKVSGVTIGVTFLLFFMIHFNKWTFVLTYLILAFSCNDSRSSINHTYTIDNHLYSSNHVDNVKARCKSKLYFMRLFKHRGLDITGLNHFYIAKCRCVLTYTSAAWFYHLSKENADSLELVQKSAFEMLLSNHSCIIQWELQFLDVSALPDVMSNQWSW